MKKTNQYVEINREQAERIADKLVSSLIGKGINTNCEGDSITVEFYDSLKGRQVKVRVCVER